MRGERHYAEERGTEISDVLEETSVVVVVVETSVVVVVVETSVVVVVVETSVVVVVVETSVVVVVVVVVETSVMVVETRAVYDPERTSTQILVGILYVHLLICCAIVLPTIRVSTVATSLNR